MLFHLPGRADSSSFLAKPKKMKHSRSLCIQISSARLQKKGAQSKGKKKGVRATTGEPGYHHKKGWGYHHKSQAKAGKGQGKEVEIRGKLGGRSRGKKRGRGRGKKRGGKKVGRKKGANLSPFAPPAPLHSSARGGCSGVHPYPPPPPRIALQRRTRANLRFA